MVLLQTNMLALTGNMVNVLFKCLAMCLSVALVCVMQTCFDFVINKCAKVLSKIIYDLLTSEKLYKCHSRQMICISE